MVDTTLPPDQDPCPTCNMGPREMADYLRTLGWGVTEPVENMDDALRFLCTDLFSESEIRALWPDCRMMDGFWYVARDNGIRWMWQLLVMDANPFDSHRFGKVTHGRVQDRAGAFGLTYRGHHDPNRRVRPDPGHPLIVEAQRRRPIGS